MDLEQGPVRAAQQEVSLNVMHFNHPETISIPHRKPAPGAKKAGDRWSRGHYAKWNKSGRERQIWFHLYMESKNKQANKTKTDSQ